MSKEVIAKDLGQTSIYKSPKGGFSGQQQRGTDDRRDEGSSSIHDKGTRGYPVPT